jgi:hypothetical protein
MLRAGVVRYVQHHKLPEDQIFPLFRQLLLLFTGLTALPDDQATEALADAAVYHDIWLNSDPRTKKLMVPDPYELHAPSPSWEARHSLSEAVVQSQRAYHQLHEKDWLRPVAAPDASLAAFAHFNFSVDPRRLDDIVRTDCPRCHSKVLFYCTRCLVMSAPVADLLGHKQVTLPVNIDMIHHYREKLTKSTGLQALLFAPSQVRLLSFPKEVPQYDPTSTLLLYPSEEASYLTELPLPLEQIKTLVFIECTWHGTAQVYQSSNLCALPHVKLRPRETRFWRTQHLGKECLATVEAIYYACVEFWEGLHPGGERAPPAWDDLLLFFAWQHHTIVERDRKPRNWCSPVDSPSTATATAAGSTTLSSSAADSTSLSGSSSEPAS